jgi:hypothetical protein
MVEYEKREGVSVRPEGDTHTGSGLAGRAGVMSFGSWCSEMRTKRGRAGKTHGEQNWIEGVHPSVLKYMIRLSKVQRGREGGTGAAML